MKLTLREDDNNGRDEVDVFVVCRTPGGLKMRARGTYPAPKEDNLYARSWTIRALAKELLEQATVADLWGDTYGDEAHQLGAGTLFGGTAHFGGLTA